MKTCSRCKKTKARSEFYRDRRNKDGLNTKCRICAVQYQHERYMLNRDARCEQDRKYRAANREAVHVRNHNWKLANKDKIAESNRKHYYKNRDRILEQQRVYRAKKKKGS